MNFDPYLDLYFDQNFNNQLDVDVDFDFDFNTKLRQLSQNH
jgi:hypothetical protein